jgi:hypothetical protein
VAARTMTTMLLLIWSPSVGRNAVPQASPAGAEAGIGEPDDYGVGRSSPP